MNLWWIFGALVAAKALGATKSTAAATGASVSTPTGAGSGAAQQPYIAPTPAGSPSTGAHSSEDFNPWKAGQKGFGKTVDTPVQNTIVAPISSGLSTVGITLGNSNGRMTPAGTST